MIPSSIKTDLMDHRQFKLVFVKINWGSLISKIRMFLNDNDIKYVTKILLIRCF